MAAARAGVLCVRTRPGDVLVQQRARAALSR
jgi:hypothetical protein